MEFNDWWYWILWLPRYDDLLEFLPIEPLITLRGGGGGVGDNLKEKTLFSLFFYGDTAYTNLFKLFLNYKASSKEYLVKFSWLKIEK